MYHQGVLSHKLLHHTNRLLVLCYDLHFKKYCKVLSNYLEFYLNHY